MIRLSGIRFRCRFACVVVCLSALLFSACCKDEETKEKTKPLTPTTPETPETLPSTLSHVMQSDFYTVEELSAVAAASPTFASFIGSNNEMSQMLENLFTVFVKGHTQSIDSIFDATVGTDASGARQWCIESHSFVYSSVDVAGRPTLLSGRVSFPNNTVEGVGHQVSTLSLYSHQLITDNQQSPSSNFTVMGLRTLWNSAVIEPDYQGRGVDDGIHDYSTLTCHALARQMSDCIMAALEVMSQRGVRLADDGYTTNWGQSLGAPPALAYAYRYENLVSDLERQAVRLRSTFGGEGPTNVVGSFRYGIDHTDYTTPFSDYLRYFVAMGEEVMHGWKIADFAPEWMLVPSISYEGKMYSYLEAQMGKVLDRKLLREARPEEYSSADPKWNFAADMLDSTDWLDPQTPKVQAFLRIMDEQASFEGWHPVHDLYLSHAKNDDFMPYLPARLLYDELHANSPEVVYWLEVPAVENAITDMVSGMGGGGVGTSMGIHMTMSAIALLYMCAAKEPADMAQFYPLTD